MQVLLRGAPMIDSLTEVYNRPFAMSATSFKTYLRDMSAGHPRDLLFFSNSASLCLKVPLVQEHKMDYTEKGMEEGPSHGSLLRFVRVLAP